MALQIVRYVYQSWLDLDCATQGLSEDRASSHAPGESAIAWTVGHVTHMVDSWLNIRFQGLPANPVLMNPDFRTGGSGNGNDWSAIQHAVEQVRQSARNLIESAAEEDLSALRPYDGSIVYLRETGLTLRYALLRIAAHHFEHVGEILTIRSRWGDVIDFPDWGSIFVDNDTTARPSRLSDKSAH
jgi:hypothetical protein